MGCVDLGCVLGSGIVVVILIVVLVAILVIRYSSKNCYFSSSLDFMQVVANTCFSPCHTRNQIFCFTPQYLISTITTTTTHYKQLLEK